MVFTSSAALGLAVWAGMSLRDDVVRYVFLERIESNDPNTRAQGIAYISRHAADDEQVFEAALQRLAAAQDADPRQIQQVNAIVQGLRYANVWGPDCRLPWVRYMANEADANAPLRRGAVALELARAGLNGKPICQSEAFAQLVARLLGDDEALVRYQALRAAAACDNAARLDLIAAATNDADATIRKHAWIMLGLADVNPNTSVERVLGSPPAEQQAMLWADANVARQLAAEPPNDPLWVARLAYPLRETDAVDWQLEWPSDPNGELIYGMNFWRSAIAAPMIPTHQQAWVDSVQRLAKQNGKVDATLAAMVSRVADRLTDMPWTGREGHRLRELAYVASAAPNSLDMPITEGLPDLVRAELVRTARGLDPNSAVLAFDADLPGVQRVAAMHAAERFNEAELNELVRKLILSYHDQRIIGGAMLAGYTGLGGDLLAQRLKREQGWVVLEHLRLGLYMQGRDDLLGAFGPGPMLANDETRAAALWAMLHRGQKTALDEIIEPLGADAGELRQALDQQRMILLIERYLPGAPRFDVWADPALQQFQVDVLRDWYLMHRGTLDFESSRTLWLNPKSF